MIPDNPEKTQEKRMVEAVHLRKAGNSKSVVIPHDLFKVLNWREGELLILYAMDNRVLIHPLDRRLVDTVEEYGKETNPVN